MKDLDKKVWAAKIEGPFGVVDSVEGVDFDEIKKFMSRAKAGETTGLYALDQNGEFTTHGENKRRHP